MSNALAYCTAACVAAGKFYDVKPRSLDNAIVWSPVPGNGSATRLELRSNGNLVSSLFNLFGFVIDASTEIS
jgi:hypothetical protein